MRYVLTYRPETAMAPELIDAGRVRVLHGEGVALFDETLFGDTYRGTQIRPLRYLARIEADSSHGVLYAATEAHQSASD